MNKLAYHLGNLGGDSPVLESRKHERQGSRAPAGASDARANLTLNFVEDSDGPVPAGKSAADFVGKQLMVTPVGGGASRLCLFSR
ncbi:hypothetical protein GTP69_00355 [Duganella sp. CY42W]|uniref:Uncharacterized protein n=1 Tax=Duganella levis TaxID=2692169 RepID=A0ABW9VTA3_9BURK|nr:hypothetical protein [Duganella levis]